MAIFNISLSPCLFIRSNGRPGKSLRRDWTDRARDWTARVIFIVHLFSLPVIVFVTGYERYVFDAFDVGAFQYLLKPVDEEKFAQVFARAAGQIEAARETPLRALTLRSAGISRTVPLERICYIESSDHKVVLHLKDGEFSCYAKLRDLEAELGDRFCRVHKGYLVNLACVEGYSRTELRLGEEEEQFARPAPPGEEGAEKGREQTGVQQFRGIFLRAAALVTLFLLSHAALFAAMLYALRRQLQKRRLSLHRRELCYLALVPTAGVLFGQVISTGSPSSGRWRCGR